MYNSRLWLNEKGKSSTGSIVAYEGPSDWSDENIIFLEISDCHEKVRLHKANNDSKKEFCNKLRIIAEEAERFARYLEAIDA